jgi:hypothetical protein
MCNLEETSTIATVHASQPDASVTPTSDTDNKFYVLSALDDSGYMPKVEYFVRNDPKEIRQIYKDSTWMHKKEHYMYIVEAGKPCDKFRVSIKNSHRKIYNTDLSAVTVCRKCHIFYLKSQVCTVCKRETESID